MTARTRARTRIRRPNGAPENPVRSVRIGDPIWTRASRRARVDGVTMSYVLATLAEGYANGKINLPTVQVVYNQAVGE